MYVCHAVLPRHSQLYLQVADQQNVCGPHLCRYKEVNTPNSLGELTDVKLVSLGVSEKEDRKLVLGAVSKAGYRAKVVEKVKTEEGRKRKTSGSSALPAGNAEETKPSTATASGSSVVSTLLVSESRFVHCERYSCMHNCSQSYPTKKAATPSPAKKRKITKKNDQNEFLPDKIREQGDEVGSLEFDEILDEEVSACPPSMVVLVCNFWSYRCSKENSWSSTARRS